MLFLDKIAFNNHTKDRKIMFNIKKILEELNEIPTIKYPITYSKKGILFYKYSNIFLIISIILLIFCIVFACLFKYFEYEFFKLMTFLFSDFSIITILIQLIFFILMSILSFITKKNESYQMLITDVEHNEKYAIQMLKYSSNDLEYAIHHLNYKIDKLESRLVAFLGNKNVAFVAVYSMSLTIFNQLGGLDNLLFFFKGTSISLSSVNQITLLGFAFFTGLILGSIILSSDISKYRNQVSLLKLSLKILSLM